MSENAFGILVARFRLFLSRIYLDEFKVKKLTKAACALHNLLCEKSRDSYAPPLFMDHEDTDDGVIVPGSWRQEVPPNYFDQHYVGCRGTRQAEDIRRHFKEFFAGPGAVPWQQKMIS